MTTDKDKLYKISCCYADNIYNKMLSKRYGIGFCNSSIDLFIEELKSVKNLYETYINTFNPEENYSCDVNKVKEYINLL